MRQVTENLGLDLGGITDEPSLIPNQVTNMIKIDEALGQGGKDDVARAAAAAAQADADQAQADAMAAAALAQEAIASSLKVKKLSDNEVQSVLGLSQATDGIRSHTGFYEFYDSFVINLTPRIKLVSASAVLALSNSFALNTDYVIAYGDNYPKRLDVIYSLLPDFDASVEITASSMSSAGFTYHVKFNGSANVSTNNSIIVTMVGFILYNRDIDLGTDID